MPAPDQPSTPAPTSAPDQPGAPDPQPVMVERTSYQMFIEVYTLLTLGIVLPYYLLPLPATVDQVLYILDSLFTPVLLFDFAARLYYAPNRLKYLVTFGWLDLLGSLPGLPALRLFRVPSLVRTGRHIREATPAEARQAARQRLAESTLLLVTLVVVIVVTVGSILIVLIEGPVAGANIKTGNDAVWWSIVTVSTVGYGDRYPVTNEGRLIGTVMIVMGVSLFSVLTSFIATQFIARRRPAGPTEADLLRQEVGARVESIRQQAAEEKAALHAELAELRTLLERLAPPEPACPRPEEHKIFEEYKE